MNEHESIKEGRKEVRQPLVSVIVPCYNMEKFLERSLSSLLMQDYTNIEILLVDDGSKDNTPSMIDEYSARYPNVRAFHKPNGGLSSARNYGMQRVNGEYIMFVDPDDNVAIDFVSSALSSALRYSADVVYFGYKTSWYSALSEMKCYYPVRDILTHNNIETIEHVLPLFLGTSDKRFEMWLSGCRDYENAKELGTVWRFIFKTDLIKSNGITFKDIKPSEDVVFVCDCLIHASVVASCRSVAYVYIPAISGQMSVSTSGDNLVNGKCKILQQRDRIADELLTRGIDISRYYAGSNVISALQIAYTLADKGKYSDWMNYVKNPSVLRSIKQVRMKYSGGIKRWLPVLLLKCSMTRTLFLCLKLARRLNIVPNVW